VTIDVAIHCHDEGEFVHHLASPSDLRAMISLLPPQVVDGLAEIVLCLGRDAQGEPTAYDSIDPYTGRVGDEVMPGVHAGKVRGIYRADGAVIELHAYVHAPDLADRRVKDLVLRLDALTTFVHAVAQHHDRTAASPSARWRADELAPGEGYAKRMAEVWARDVVVPYLERAYPDEVDHLGVWTAEHGGLCLPLPELVAEPSEPCDDGSYCWGHMFGVRAAFETLLDDVAAGLESIATRIEVARQLHYAEDYARARAILADVVAAHPGHVEALTLEADIDVHEEEFARAEAVARGVLARDPTAGDAWTVLFDALHGQARWAALVEAMAAGRPHVRPTWLALQQRARAFFELGDDDALAADLAGLALGHVRAQQAAMGLRATWLLRHERLDEALAIARAAFAERYRPPIEAIAARFEAAHRLGRPDDAGRLTAHDLARLRGHGHGAWADRLLAAHGAHLADVDA
jgi:hypothetical protein